MHRAKAWLAALAVLVLTLVVVVCVRQAWTDPGKLTGRDGFWVVQLAGLCALYGVIRFVVQVVRADRRRLEDGDER